MKALKCHILRAKLINFLSLLFLIRNTPEETTCLIVRRLFFGLFVSEDVPVGVHMLVIKWSDKPE